MPLPLQGLSVLLKMGDYFFHHLRLYDAGQEVGASHTLPIIRCCRVWPASPVTRLRPTPGLMLTTRLPVAWQVVESVLLILCESRSFEAMAQLDEGQHKPSTAAKAAPVLIRVRREPAGPTARANRHSLGQG